MTAKDLLNRLKQSPEPPIDVPTSPPIELVGIMVQCYRAQTQWKISTLADFAGVSISTIERVERGEKVSDEALDRIARAFGFDAGYFTRPRNPVGPEVAAAQMVEKHSNLEVVPVEPMRSHRVARKAARCHGYLVHRPGVPDLYNGDIARLQGRLFHASNILADFGHGGSPLDGGSPDKCGRRELYNDILACVRELEGRGLTVLCGVISTPQVGLPDCKAAIISITQRTTDPGAPKRRGVIVDRRVVAPVQREDRAGAPA